MQTENSVLRLIALYRSAKMAAQNNASDAEVQMANVLNAMDDVEGLSQFQIDSGLSCTSVLEHLDTGYLYRGCDSSWVLCETANALSNLLAALPKDVRSEAPAEAQLKELMAIGEHLGMSYAVEFLRPYCEPVIKVA